MFENKKDGGLGNSNIGIELRSGSSQSSAADYNRIVKSMDSKTLNRELPTVDKNKSVNLIPFQPSQDI